MARILLTGSSGFIAKHIALRLLDAGHEVRGTLRGLNRVEEVHAALRPALADATALDRLGFVACDLEEDTGWAEAATGMDTVVHTASPFPIAQPKDEAEVIRPAVEGTLRVLRAAKKAGATRVVLTSSTVAVLDDAKTTVQDESDWCHPERPTTTPYAKSKTLAERAAWEFASANGIALTTINPGLVLGPPLDAHFGSSLSLVQRILKGRDPMMPDIGFPIVDVRDVAEMHLRAVLRPTTAGRRFIASAGSLSMPEMGRILKAAYPTRRIPTRTAPALVVKLLAVFDPEVKAILPKLGKLEQVSNLRAVQEMGMRFIVAEEALRASAAWLVQNRLVWF